MALLSQHLIVFNQMAFVGHAITVAEVVAIKFMLAMLMLTMPFSILI